MKNYISYMNDQQVSADLHQKLLEIGAHPTVKTRNARWKPILAMAACCALIATAALSIPGLLSVPAGRCTLYAGDSSNADDAGQSAVVAPPDDLRIDDPPMDNSGTFGGTMLPMLPAVSYPDVTRKSSVAFDICWPEGSFTVDLTEEQISLILWGTQERFNAAGGALPWMLFWEDYTLIGQARYDGEGSLCQVTIQGQSPASNSFTLSLAPSEIPPTCVVHPDAAVTEVRGVEISGWKTYYDRDGDGSKEYVYETTFIAHEVGIRFQSVSQAENILSPSLVNWATYADGGLSLEHLLTSENVPAWRSEKFSTLAEARAEADFAPYLPESYPFPYGELSSWLNYQENSHNTLYVRWSTDCDDVEIDIRLPEGEGGIGMDVTPVDVAVPASYDTRLYEIPWADSVPEAYRAEFFKPTFRAEDMSLAVIEARSTEKDTGGNTYRFYVLHENGALVGYSCDGLTAADVWSLVEPTL